MEIYNEQEPPDLIYNAQEPPDLNPDYLGNRLLSKKYFNRLSYTIRSKTYNRLEEEILDNHC